MKHKPFEIPKRLIYEAWKSVKRAAGGAGVDGITIDVYEQNLSGNLYKLWNRMSSGSYLPPPVRQVAIPKADGSSRILGIPTVEDRIAQAAVKMTMEAVCEPIFHQDSYGYRPGVSAIDAVATCRKRCWYNDWVIDLDIVGCFDNIPHDLLLRAVDKHVSTKWERLYIVRWLQAGAISPVGERLETVKGTPQGAVISPLLCNLFFHYALDTWMVRELPKIPFERYADDGVFHCRTKVQATFVLDRIRKRLGDLGLQLHPAKTRIVFCARGQQAKGTENVPRSFTFLGYDFKPRETHKDKSDKNLTFTPGVGKAAKKRLLDRVKTRNVCKRSDLSMTDIAKEINPMVRGWLNYFRHFRISDTYSTLFHLDRRLVKWMKDKYKIGTTKAQRRLTRMKTKTPELFAHWGTLPEPRKYGLL
jgi:RNA-directed DNA polymerase